jgi:hypothetical protein
MLDKAEEDFLVFWEQRRAAGMNHPLTLIKGFSWGLMIGAGVVLMLEMGWYQRADMVAHGKMNAWVLLIGLALIATFLSFFYSRYRWEMNEQHYQELRIKKQKTSTQSDQIV